MAIDFTIPANRNLKVNSTVLMLFLTAVLIGSVFRVSLLVIYPFVSLVIFIGLKLRFTKYIFDLLILAGISLLLSFFSGFFLTYKLVSLYYMLPFIILLFASPGDSNLSRQDLVKVFISMLTVIAFINDIVGFIQFLRNPKSDDSFTGIYSSYTVSLAGLSILNSILFTWYFFHYLQFRSRRYLYRSVFFFVSSVMSFYGAGLIIFVAAFILTFVKPKLFSLLKVGFISVVALYSLYYFLTLVKPNVVDYYRTNLRRLAGVDRRELPRKLLSFYNYADSYPTNAKDLLFGSGPGTFNSRSAFMIGSPSYFTTVTFIKSEEQPYYFKNYAYTLWNHTNTSQARFQDGFRNQPFSSILAFLGEYGLIFTFFFGLYYVRIYRRMTSDPPADPDPLYKVYRRINRFIFIYLPALLVIDNYYEYPEVMLLLVVIMKLLHIGLNRMKSLPG
jgi:hypothetical protein